LSAPDYSECFVGWKGLLADSEGRLFSPSRRVEWPANEALVAECDLFANHNPPHPQCGCGIYVVDSFETLKAVGYNWGDHDESEQWLIAEVNLWGKVRKGQVGFRATRAYPKRIYVPAYLWEVGNAVRQRYSISMQFIDRFASDRFTGRRT
jgi:hypothetical protein